MNNVNSRYTVSRALEKSSPTTRLSFRQAYATLYLDVWHKSRGIHNEREYHGADVALVMIANSDGSGTAAEEHNPAQSHPRVCIEGIRRRSCLSD